MLQRLLRLLACCAAVAALTFVAFRVVPVNATTVGFGYLLLILMIASTWGFLEAALSSVFATLTFNFFFLPPVGTFTIADPENWVALFSFLTTSLVASRLSLNARRRAHEAVERQHDVERLYTFSRAILLMNQEEPVPKQIVQSLAAVFEFSSVVLYERRTRGLFQAGPSDFNALEEQLRDAAMHGTSFADAAAKRMIVAVRLGSQPIASLAVEGVAMADSVLQEIANLVAIGLERARAQELAHEIKAARESERLRTTLIDAMAHEFKTPLTLVKGVTTSVLAGSPELSPSTREQLVIADEEAEHLAQLIDNAIEMARLDTARIEIHPELVNLGDLVDDVLASMRTATRERRLEVVRGNGMPPVPLDKRLVKLALKQLVDNALKYSPPELPVAIRTWASNGAAGVEVIDHGEGIAKADEDRIFERFYRGDSVRTRIPGTGLGLNIARSIVQAHHGELTMTSQPGETKFQIKLPTEQAGGRKD